MDRMMEAIGLFNMVFSYAVVVAVVTGLDVKLMGGVGQ